MMYAGERQFKVVQTWRLKAGRGVELTTKLIDPKGGKKGAAATNTGSCEASEGALSTLALEKAEAIMAGKREAARRQGVPQSGGGRSWADNQMCCPVIASIKGSYEGEGTRTRNAASNAGAAAGPTEVSGVCNTIYVFLFLLPLLMYTAAAAATLLLYTAAAFPPCCHLLLSSCYARLPSLP